MRDRPCLHIEAWALGYSIGLFISSAALQFISYHYFSIKLHLGYTPTARSAIQIPHTRTQLLRTPHFHLRTKGHNHHNPAILIPPLAPHHSSLIFFLAKKPTPWFTDMVYPEYSTREPLSCRLSTPSLREPYHRNSDRGETNGPSGRPSHWYQALGLLLAPCVLRKRCRP